jgi:hypothetical protein
MTVLPGTACNIPCRQGCIANVTKKIKSQGCGKIIGIMDEKGLYEYDECIQLLFVMGGD